MPPRGLPAKTAPSALLLQCLIALAAFGVGVGIAEAAGAINLGTAFGVGQITFAVTATYFLLRR